MIKRTNSGFTLIELLVVVVIMGFVLAATTDTFVGLLRGYKQQSKIAETNIEGIIGLELMRQDIERAGFGLPWAISSAMPDYSEAATAPASNYNDSTHNPPSPILNGHDGWVDPGSGLANSDYLVIKATNVPRSTASQLWSYMTTSEIKSWSPASENPQPTDYVIVLSPGTGNGDARSLLNAGAKLQDIALPAGNDPQPELIFGISPDTAPLRPFNRADFMILGPGQTIDKIPSRCAPNAGVLVKKVLNQSNGSNSTEILPLLDCVADLKVIFRLDTNGDGAIETVSDTVAGLSAQDIRKQMKEIRVYILAHEGQKDQSFTYSNPSPAPCTSSTQIYVGHRIPICAIIG